MIEVVKIVKDSLYLIGIDKFFVIVNLVNKVLIKVMKNLGMMFSYELEYKDNLFYENVVVYVIWLRMVFILL